MNCLRVANIVVSSNLVKKFSHFISSLHIRFGILGVLNFFNTGQWREKLEVFPQQLNTVFVPIVLFRIVCHDIHSVARYVESRISFGNL